MRYFDNMLFGRCFVFLLWVVFLSIIFVLCNTNITKPLTDIVLRSTKKYPEPDKANLFGAMPGVASFVISLFRAHAGTSLRVRILAF